jgi:putative endonuclease
VRVQISNTQSKSSKRKTFDCFCYIVECADGTFYTGWTTDLKRRVAAHNAGRGSRYTRLRRPVKLVYFEHQPNRSEAMRREVKIKRMSRSAKLRLVARRVSHSDTQPPTSDSDPRLVCHTAF